MNERLRTTPRPAMLAVIPLVVGAALAWHPTDPTHAADLEGVIGRWLAVHLVLLAGMPALALLVQWMLRGLSGRLAAVARLTIVPAAALYVAFETLVGSGTGVLVAAIGDMPAAEQAGAAALTEVWWQVPTPVAVLAGTAIAAWTTSIAITAIALHRAGMGRLPAWALTASALLFAAGHPGITGAAAMASMALAVVAVARHRDAAVRHTERRGSDASAEVADSRGHLEQGPDAVPGPSPRTPA